MFDNDISRRKFLDQIRKTGFCLSIGLPWNRVIHKEKHGLNPELFLDWTLWGKYRHTVHHPCLTIKNEDVNRARVNIQRFEWARNYTGNIKRQADYFIDLIRKHGLDNLIEVTTPGDPLWTPCPSCRDNGQPVHPHGRWNWTIKNPDQLVCAMCQETFPNDKYPEDIKLQSSWDKTQSFTFYGGEPFKIFGFDKGRPSFSANIRSRKVQWCADASRIIAEAYLLEKNPIYARECKAILNRFAYCYPNWLVHVGYGEYADMDPRVASLHIKNLPEDELTPPPNKPDRQLWTGYWSAGRASGVGLESDFIRKIVESYDFTCQADGPDHKSVYSKEEQIRIEQDLLLESTILLVCDKQINNKAVRNRTAVGMVGMCVGHPELMRFGLDGFDKTVKEWFLKDGSTKESPFYGLMTLGGIIDFAQAARHYGDPPGYRDTSDKRIEELNVYDDSAFKNVWKAFYLGLGGDLTFPPYADSFHSLDLDPSYIELMANNYKDQPQYLSLLKNYCGEHLERPTGPVPARYYMKDMHDLSLVSMYLPYDLARPACPSSYSLYYREPTISDQKGLPVQLPSWNPPDLKIGHMRTGVHGRESLLLLNASHWRGHNHWDSLNLYYWKKDQAILSDFGYLWDHPKEEMTSRTLAHNTVVINEKNQISKNRGGKMLRFRSSPYVKLMEAESDAYEETTLYRRTSVIIDHGNGRNYVVDFFRVQGGDIHDYVFHLDTLKFSLSERSSWEIQPDSLYDFDKTQLRKSNGPWQILWSPGGNMNAKAWMMNQPDEKAYINTGWGQKDWENSDVGAKATYVVRRSKGNNLKTFVSVFEGADTGNFFVKNVSYNHEQNLLVIGTSEGTDYIMSALDNEKVEISTDAGELTYVGHFVAVSIQNNQEQWKLVME